MIGIYYVFLVVISVPVYVLSTTFKEKKNKVGKCRLLCNSFLDCVVIYLAVKGE